MATVITSRSESVLHYLNPIAMVQNLWRHRDLIRQFTRREIEGRYKGSFLGLFWSFINPLALLLIYTFVFGIVLKSRWPQARTENIAEFAVILLCGLITFNIFGDTVNRAPTNIVEVPNYVKKVIFPLEVLPISILGSSLFHALIGLFILLSVNLIVSGGSASWTLILLPIIWLPLILLTLGITWFLASLGVFVRDIRYTIAILTQAMFFLTPVFYSIDSVPKEFKLILNINPLAPIIEMTRGVLLWQKIPDFWLVAQLIVIAFIWMIFGYAWFMRTKKAFADVL